MNSSILMALSRHDDGHLIENADELMQNCVRDVTRYGQKATLTITLTLSPNGDKALKLDAAVKATLPKRPQGSAFYWPTEDFSLTRTPPKDDDLLLRSIPSGVAKA